MDANPHGWDGWENMNGNFMDEIPKKNGNVSRKHLEKYLDRANNIITISHKDLIKLSFEQLLAINTLQRKFSWEFIVEK